MKLREEIRKKTGLEGIGFEIVGDIAIVEFPKYSNMNKDIKEKIADIIKKYNPNVNVVVEKIEDVSGTYRVANHVLIKMWDRKEMLEKLPKEFRSLSWEETLHIEHGVRCLLNINKTYFSSKLGFERKRIAEQVREGERILLLFSGTGIFGLVIAKQKDVKIDAVEINPYSCEYADKNLKINKLKGKMVVYCQDVEEFINKKEVLDYDRILMPAPKDAPAYLEKVIKKAKTNTIIHYYFFEDVHNISEGFIKERFSHLPVKVAYYRKAGSIGTKTYRVVVDLVRV